MAISEYLQRQLASIKQVFAAGVRCPSCKAGLTEKLPGIALGFIISCPHCGVSFINPIV